MGRTAGRPEEADSWGEFHSRLEIEMTAGQGGWLVPLWWVVGVVAFVVGLMSCGYAFERGHWWLWPCAFGALAVDGVLAARAIDRAERCQAREAELARMWDAWLDHLASGGPNR